MPESQRSKSNNPHEKPRVATADAETKPEEDAPTRTDAEDKLRRVKDELKWRHARKKQKK
jgi:hypothetical protein